MRTIIRFLILASICVAPDVAQTDPVADLRTQIEAATTDPDRIRLRLKLADQFVNTGQRSEALKELDGIAKSGAFDPPGFYNLGNSFARLGETESALNAYHEAINQRRGKYSRAYNNMGVILLREGRWDEAYDALIAALKIESFHYAEASYNLGRLYAARGQKDLAAREWRRALIVDPQHDAAKQALANAGNEENIVVVSDATRELPVQFWNAVAQQRVELLNCTPSYFETIVRDTPETLSLGHLVVGGEAFTT